MAQLSDLAHLYPGVKLPEGPHSRVGGDSARRSSSQMAVQLDKSDSSGKSNLVDSFTVKKLVILSQLAVFKDICPGYRIRPPSEEERGVKVSKEVRQLREYEARLLAEYQFYLQRLSKLACAAQKQAPAPKDLGLALVAVQCLADLLKALHHFNFAGNIVSTLIPITDSQHESLIDPARSAIKPESASKQPP